MSSKKYSMAFSSGGLLYNESLLVLDVYLQVKDWGVTRKSIIDANTLQSSPLSREEYDLFFEYKAEWYEEFERVKPSTRKKTRQTLFQIMREAQILSTENLIIPAIPSGSFLQCVMADNQKWLRAFPVSEAEIKRRLI